MIRFAVLILALSIASSVHALPLASIQSPDGVTVMARQGCGVGFRRIGNRCVRNTAVRKFRRCAAGYRLVGGRCIR
jgi:hypothetical protein